MIWLIGNKGMLGSDVEKALADKQLPYCASDREVDITDFSSVSAYATDKKINWIINCSAYTAVDRAEDEEYAAFKVNADGAGNLARFADELGAKLVHISTDYVFSGNKDGAYLEEDETGPTGVYGRSKLEGEIKIQAVLKEFFIIRTSWLYGEHGNNFVFTMLRLFNERERVSVVNDQSGTPTWSKDLAAFILKIVGDGSSEYGVYHYSNEGRATWYGFAEKIYSLGRREKLVNKDTEISGITTDQYPTKAKRPANSLMSKEKAKRVFKINIPEWDVSLEKFFNEIKKDKP